MSNKSDLLDIFWKLSDQKEPARIEAASRILTTLTKTAKVTCSYGSPDFSKKFREFAEFS